jgi:hypothetical protein
MTASVYSASAERRETYLDVTAQAHAHQVTVYVNGHYYTLSAHEAYQMARVIRLAARDARRAAQ